MSFDTFQNFLTEIKQFADWSDATTAQLTSLVRIAEPQINSVLRVRTMESSTAVTVDADGIAAVPADYVDAKNAYIEGARIKVLERSSVDYIYRAFPNRSQQNAGYTRPKFARGSSGFIFGPPQGSGDVMRLSYFAKPAAQLMADSGTIHATFSAYAQVYLFGSLCRAEVYIGHDSRIPVWKQAYEESLASANAEIQREAASGGALGASTS